MSREVAEALNSVDWFEDSSTPGEQLPTNSTIRQWIKPIQKVMNAWQQEDFLWAELN